MSVSVSVRTECVELVRRTWPDNTALISAVTTAVTSGLMSPAWDKVTTWQSIYKHFHTFSLDVQEDLTSIDEPIDVGQVAEWQHSVPARSEVQEDGSIIARRLDNGMAFIVDTPLTDGLLRVPSWRPRLLPGWAFLTAPRPKDRTRRLYVAGGDHNRHALFAQIAEALRGRGIEFEGKVSTLSSSTRADQILFWVRPADALPAIEACEAAVGSAKTSTQLPGLAVRLSNVVAGAWEHPAFAGRSYGQFVAEELAECLAALSGKADAMAMPRLVQLSHFVTTGEM